MTRPLPPEITQKAAQIQATLGDQVRAARSDPNLSDEGRGRVITTAYEQANGEMQQLRQKWADDTSSLGKNLARELFGSIASSGSDAISIRDADDRVAQLSNAEQAGGLLVRAEANGDGVLARAIALRAFNATFTSGIRGLSGPWLDVLKMYLEPRPQLAARIDALAEIEGPSSAQRAMRQQMVFSVVRPPEVNQTQARSGKSELGDRYLT